ncbi:insulinase family protein [Noviherbaspirillum sp. Root189]|uniref:insulinase family protein n=1 Tax=Noviherbaspirillum sp. Root189 TaxID=1736487 RepID=UPI00070BF3EB|nr:insulinase family protein [Noviherbaspirillum sp. Root189]KRB93754.1 peptidase [Noviherbaspirillum sp. Root189]
MTFETLRSRHIPAMQAEVQEYEDSATGARHIHLATNDAEMVFLVGFPTVPDVSDGRAHILEHLALCGSDRYPVRDPFFAMSRRSIAHFMNAMTYADKTVYPFASTDKTDFFNLLDVYLDAAFFPRLDYLDFLQEGWRLALEDGKLAYQGIVFNEMKGAFADPVRALDSGIAARLMRGTTYAVESGGDPLDIPSLTHTALKEFHASHYHPSQAVFMTAGGVDPREVQALIEERVLSRLSGRSPRLLPELAGTWTAPETAELQIPSRDHGVQIAWLMGESVDPVAYYRAELLEGGLLGNSAAPLMRAMESAGFGRPSALNGTDAGGRQMVFHLGMEGLTKAQVGKARDRIWQALEQTAKEGVSPDVLQATLRDIRFHQREISGGSTPHLLKCLLRAMPHEMYGGDIMNAFDSEDVLQQMQEDIADPAFFKGLVKELLANTTRLDSSVLPDPDYFQKRKQIEEERLATLQATLPESEKERIRAESVALLERQRQPVNNDLLPRIHPSDVSATSPAAYPLPANHTGTVITPIASNGITYARVLYNITHLPEEAWPWLQLYVEVVPELGVAGRTYEETDAWRHKKVPFFDINLQVSQAQDDRTLRIHADYYAKGLREEQRAIAEVLSESIRSPRFDELDRLAFLIDSKVQDIRDGLADEGDDYARYTAAAALSPLRRFEDQVKGVSSLAFFRMLHEKLESEQGLKEIASRLADVHASIIASPSMQFVAGDEADAHALAQLLHVPQGEERLTRTAGDEAPAVPVSVANAAVHADAQVNHCFAVWPGPTLDHPDAAALSVLGELLTNIVLHQALREEGGAYGGNAFYSPATGTFSMTSYRDPRLAATYQDFERAIAWVSSAELKQENIEEAIICVIQHLDRPRSPYGNVMWTWEQQQQGISEQMRQQYREGVLRCTADRLKQVAATWLQDKPYSRAAFVGNPTQPLAGLEVIELAALAG